MVENNQIDLMEVVQLVIRNKFKVIAFTITGFIIGIYIALQNYNKSTEYGIDIYGFTAFEISSIIDSINQTRSLRLDILSEAAPILSKNGLTDDSVIINLQKSSDNTEQYFLDSFTKTKNKNQFFLDIVYNKIYYSELVNNILVSKEKYSKNLKINKNNVISKIKFKNQTNKSSYFKPISRILLNLDEPNQYAHEFLEEVLVEAVNNALLEFNEQYILSINEIKKVIDKDIQFVSSIINNNKVISSKILNDYKKFLILNYNYAKKNNIKSKAKENLNSLKFETMNENSNNGNEILNSIQKNMANLQYYLKGEELINLEINFISNNQSELNEILHIQKPSLLSILYFLKSKGKELNSILEQYNSNNILTKKYNLDTSNKIIIKKRNHILIYILSSTIIFLILGIFTAILLDKRK